MCGGVSTPPHVRAGYLAQHTCFVFFVDMSKTLELSATYNLEYVIGFSIEFFYSSIDGSKTLQVYEV